MQLQSGGKTLEPIFSRQGVKQGDLLSSILFIFLIDWIDWLKDRIQIGWRNSVDIALLWQYGVIGKQLRRFAEADRIDSRSPSSSGPISQSEEVSYTGD